MITTRAKRNLQHALRLWVLIIWIFDRLKAISVTQQKAESKNYSKKETFRVYGLNFQV